MDLRAMLLLVVRFVRAEAFVRVRVEALDLSVVP
jgi:hypothetical protein